MTRFAALAVIALLPTACDQPAATNQAAAPQVRVRSEAQNRLHKLNDLDRAIGLKRAIYGSGSTCKRVTDSNFIGQYKNMDMWAVRCADDREWALFVGADDSVQVRLCKDTEAVGLPPCKFASPTDTKKAADAKPAA